MKSEVPQKCPLVNPRRPPWQRGQPMTGEKSAMLRGRQAAYLSLEIQFTKYLQESICVYVYLSNIK